jgi:L-fuculose-phosphate aldolase
MDVINAREQIVAYTRACYSKGLVSAAGGNISMRVGDQVLITATNESFRETNPEGIVTIDLDGNVIHAEGGRKPSKESKLHLTVYRKRPEASCVIHVHPVFCIAGSIVDPGGFPLPTVSAKLKIREVGIVPIAAPGSRELIDGIITALDKGTDSLRVLLMERHGLLIFDETMKSCCDLVELAEETAKINYLVRSMTKTISVSDVQLA